MGRASDKCRSCRDRLFHRVNRIIDRPRDVSLALETERGSGGGLFLRQTVNPIIHDDVSHLDVFACRVIEMIAADGKSVAIAAENEHVQIGSRKGNAAREGERTAMDVMSAVGLHEIRKAARAADTGYGRDFLMPHFALFDQLEIKGEHREIAAA